MIIINIVIIIIIIIIIIIRIVIVIKQCPNSNVCETISINFCSKLRQKKFKNKWANKF